MGIHLQWSKEVRNTLLICFESPWSWEEFYAMVSRGRAMAQSANRVVDLVLDVRQCSYPPEGAIWRFRAVAETCQLYRVNMVFVGANPFIRSLAGVFTRVYGCTVGKLHFSFATNLDDAYRLLENQHRPKEYR